MEKCGQVSACGTQDFVGGVLPKHEGFRSIGFEIQDAKGGVIQGEGKVVRREEGAGLLEVRQILMGQGPGRRFGAAGGVTFKPEMGVIVGPSDDLEPGEDGLRVGNGGNGNGTRMTGDGGMVEQGLDVPDGGVPVVEVGNVRDWGLVAVVVTLARVKIGRHEAQDDSGTDELGAARVLQLIECLLGEVGGDLVMDAMAVGGVLDVEAGR